MSSSSAGAGDAAAFSSALLHWTRDAVVGADAQGLINELNPAAEGLFGWTRDEALGLPLEVLVPEDRRHLLRERLEQVRQGAEPEPFETVGQHRQGSRQPVVVHVIPVRVGGAYAGALGVVRSLTDWERQGGRLDRVLSATPMLLATFDHRGVVGFTAGGAGQELAELMSPGTDLLTTAPTGSPLRTAVSTALAGGSAEVQLALGGRQWQCHTAPFEDPDDRLHVRPAPVGGFLTALDVTHERRLSDQLDQILALSSLCLATFDRSGTITYAAGAGYRALGIEPQSTIGSRMLDLYGANTRLGRAIADCLEGEAVDLVAEQAGSVWDVHVRPYSGADGEVQGGIAIAQGTAGVPGAAHPAQLLERDELTGLPGRQALRRRLLQPRPSHHERAVAILDVDSFSLVQEGHGAQAADDVLRALVERMAPFVGDATFGRWETDEFMLVVDAPDALRQATSLVTDMLAAARAELPLESITLYPSCSAGLADSRTSPGVDLVGPADRALDAARRLGGDRLQLFTPDLKAPARPDLAITHALRRAAKERDFDAFEVFYQPVVELSTRRVTGVEALLRWHHPTHGLLAPDRFMVAAESTGAIEQLGEWVLGQACTAAKTLLASSTALQTVSVNLSSRQLALPTLPAQVQEALRQHDLPPTALVLEVTESSVTEDVEAAAGVLQELKGLGVRLALDDFGTGFSSLLYLKHFPVDVLKIDRSFVSGIGNSSDDAAIVAATISLASTLEISCVAEGVETMEQLLLLRKMGCRYGQGYVFSRPRPLPELERWLGEHTVRPGGKRRRSESQEPPAVIRQILQMQAEGASLHTIAAALNTEGTRTRRGLRWSAPSVASVVAGSVYPQLRLPGEGHDQD